MDTACTFWLPCSRIHAQQTLDQIEPALLTSLPWIPLSILTQDPPICSLSDGLSALHLPAQLGCESHDYT